MNGAATLGNASRIVTVGSKTALGSNSPSRDFAAIFEDDGGTGYFYALNAFEETAKILDVVNIYVLEDVSERRTPCDVKITWSSDGWRVLLTIDAYPHAVFDFLGKEGYCRTNYPNVPRMEDDEWRSDDHMWNDSALRWFEADDYDRELRSSCEALNGG